MYFVVAPYSARDVSVFELGAIRACRHGERHVVIRRLAARGRSIYDRVMGLSYGTTLENVLWMRPLRLLDSDSQTGGTLYTQRSRARTDCTASEASILLEDVDRDGQRRLRSICIFQHGEW